MMKKYLKNQYTKVIATALVIPAMLLGACKKLIEIPPSLATQVSTARVYSDSTNVISALAGVYAGFGAGSYVFNINGGLLDVYTGLSSDETVYSFPGYAPLDAISANNIQPDNAITAGFWSTGYQGIYSVNAFLEGVTGNTKISASFQNQVRGEALLTRSLYYFNLVNIFGGVPIITSTDYKINTTKARATVDEVYSLIISDLTTAISLMSDKYPSAGRLRPDVNAARALLARVYLYRGRWKEASDMSSLIINSGLYDLVAPNVTFTDGSREAIWQMLTLDPYNQTAVAQSFVPYDTTSQPTYILSDNLINAFEAGDKRFTAWTGKNTDGITSWIYPAKYKNHTKTDSPLEQWMIFRIGEQYLIRAEALANQGLLDEARADINRIRTRAGLGNTTAVTKDEVLAVIAKERQTELFDEWGHRWFDLKRTGKATAVLGPLKPNWTASDELYPIPLSEIKTNPFLVQNPGY
ncbi:RagB/SusD family nutrient uptake outer membrane protein [Mucilaginibacter corticis]|uniref:RagB/SusD family nutrient uptake outer membrane protein n=1 Tax=Mucilaginibacter corticis TaxID=2597670 RepID=A0A556MXF3_9SPHI|nr:RagB/SusD family nutrient uptake outer membrane protein [Mucilaginibacter corticis]TSJ44479.1 RagB/SusD family nutrient uptake outer membrane protein [Mucilaginibacter corticis]